MSCERSEEFFITPKGQRLFSQCWRPPGREHRALVVGTHGYCEHSFRYRSFATRLARAGMVVCFYDLRGHGRSEGTRGHVDEFADYTDDLGFYLEHCRQQYPDLPLLLFGHSLGGLITLAFLQTPGPLAVSAAAVTSPFLELALPVPGLKVFFARRVQRIYPKFAIPPGFSGKDLTRDPAIAAGYDADPLVLKRATVGWFFTVREAQRRFRAHPERITIPTILIQAGKDKLADAETTSHFAAHLNQEKSSFHLIPEAYHEVVNDPEAGDQVNEWIHNWYEQWRPSCENTNVG